MDDSTAWELLSLEQQLNVQCDLLAKEAVIRFTQQMCNEIEDLDLSSQFLPGERSAILIDGIKQTTDPCLAIRLLLGNISAKKFLCSKNGWNEEQFNEVDWGHSTRHLRANLQDTVFGSPNSIRTSGQPVCK